MKLLCFPIESNPPKLSPARRDRPWMDALKNANRCLPLAIANSYGWDLLTPAAFSIHWNGGPDHADLRIECEGDMPWEGFAQSNFSDGILTFNAGYIFRTDPGWHLMVTGPMNHPKDGIIPLSGVVETDWLPFPFTMNWRFTRPGTVRFEKDEPFCRVIPVAAQALEATQPEIHSLESNQELADQFRMWREQREFFRLNRRSGEEQAVRAGWQKYYFKGKLADGQTAPTAAHIQKQRLAEPLDLRPAPQNAAPSQATASEPPRISSAEGHVATRGGRIWYRRVGNSQATPLLVVSGGPGLPHDYLDSLAGLAEQRPVVFYDPLGCGRSDRPTDERLWSAAQLLDDLRHVRDALGLGSVHLFGHGFGALLAAEHTLRSAGIASLTLASPCLDVPRWMADGERLRGAMPAEFQTIYARAMAENNLNGSAYQATVRNFYRRHFCRNQPWPQSLTRAFSGIGHGPHGSLWGPSPLFCTGSLREYSIGDRLRSLTVPLLLTCGAHDLATPETTAEYQRQVDGAQLIVFAHSSHTPHLEEPAAYLSALGHFLLRHEPATNAVPYLADLGDSHVATPTTSDR